MFMMLMPDKDAEHPDYHSPPSSLETVLLSLDATISSGLDGQLALVTNLSLSHIGLGGEIQWTPNLTFSQHLGIGIQILMFAHLLLLPTEPPVQFSVAYSQWF